VPPKARIALFGPSGSGKSTLLHMIAGLEKPTTGELAWPALHGHPRGRPQAVGVVFQGPSLIPTLDVVQNVALPLLFARVGVEQARKKAQDALDILELTALARRVPDELSGGQAQRVAIARVLAAAPRLILADEPTGQLDHATAQHVIAVLLAAADSSGAGLVVSTHDPTVTDRLASRWAMRAGMLSFPGSSSSTVDDVRRPTV
jgi:ABC-type lipoprotein export system ATPase subunit